ncbi:respiratory nitrate reductase subunit gamma [Salisediminibacterium halotolerans]|uniref:Nitrate reductase gamma subunit n=1 Tax=Salisediminibacterium halotolerans TaxID=517425 RepID=A0A1H9S1M2_9BACI|nr:respiratory nitrate reductase subunit gamma [Salisediminibacterium haloalkalitolerans]SER78911.1 nitrate reductase gamma subunit [Salisediminibacterium haloalkalitolerans]
MELLLWGVLPYVAMVLFIGGHIVRYQYDQFGWTAKSSEFLESKDLRYGSIMLHWGLIFVLFGHILGLVIPLSFYQAIGISHTAYHYLAIGAGIPAGLIAFAGLLLLIRRRIMHRKLQQTTSLADKLALGALFIVIASGLSATFMNVDAQGFDYRESISPWFRGIFALQVQPELMSDVPVWFKTHILAATGLFVVWPFTRLVHVFSFPVMYLTRSPIVYRKQRNKKAS